MLLSVNTGINHYRLIGGMAIQILRPAFLLESNISLTLISYCSSFANADETNAVAFTACHLYFHIISILYSKHVSQRLSQECLVSPRCHFQSYPWFILNV